MNNDKLNLYNKNTKRQDIIDYGDKLEFRLQQEKDSQKKLGFWLHYLTFIFSFLIGAAVVRIGMEMLNRNSFEWFILVVIIIVLSPIAYLFIKEVTKT